MHAGIEHEVRNLMNHRLTHQELWALARRAGSARELVGPRRLSEVDGSSEEQIIAYLAEDPGRIRRPIIDTGESLLLGWNARTRQALGS